jgi:structure-specific recognition protein 1
MAFVIALDVPIRQGQQRYHNLVLETTKVEETMTMNLSTEEIAEKYDGELAPEMYAPMSTHFAKLFKVLSQKRVFVPKQVHILSFNAILLLYYCLFISIYLYICI